MRIASLPYQYVPNPTKGAPVFNGSMYFGVPDLDPKIALNQIAVSIQQENGSIIPVAQPIQTGAGGVPLYNGSPAIILVNESVFSIRVDDYLGAQKFYQARASSLETSVLYTTNVLEVDTLKGATDSLESLTGMASGAVAQTKGYWIISDGGHGTYRYDSTSVATVNGFTVINASGGAGRWLLLPASAPFYSARVAGLKLDGITNDSTAFGVAIDVIGSAGGGYLVIDGPCLLSSNKTIDYDNVFILGVSERGNLIRGGGTNGFMLNWAVNANTVGGGLINIKLTGVPTLTDGSAGVRFGNGLSGGSEKKAHRFVAHDVTCDGWAQYGLGIESGDNWDVRNVKILNHGQTTGVLGSCIGFYVFPDVASTGGFIDGVYSEISAAAQANASLNAAAIKLQCHQNLNATNLTAIGGSEEAMSIDSITGIVRGIIITPQGNNAGLTLVNYNASHSFSGQEFTIDGVEINGSSNFALIPGGGGDGTNHSLTGCTVRNVKSKNGRASSANNYAVKDCLFENWEFGDIRLSTAYNSQTVSAAVSTGNIFRNLAVRGGSQTGVFAIDATDSEIKNCSLSSITGDTVNTFEVFGSNNEIDGTSVNDSSTNAIKITGDSNTISNTSLKNITGRSIWFPAGSDNNAVIDPDFVFLTNGSGYLDSGAGNTRSHMRGATSVADGGTITHLIGADPTTPLVTASVAGEMASVTSKNSTTFVVALKKHDGTAGTTQTVYWHVIK